MSQPPLSDALRAAHARIAELEAERDVLYQLLDAVPAMVLYKGPQSRIQYANAAFRTFYGMTTAELRGIIDAPFNEPDYTQQYIKDDQQVFESGETLNIPSEPVTRHDGVVELFHTIKSPVRDADGTIIGTVGISQNISEEQRMLRQLQAAEERYERLIANIPGMVYQFELHPDGTMKMPYASVGSRDIYGLEPEVIMDDVMVIVNLIHADDMAGFQTSVLESAQTMQPWRWEGRIVLDGQIKWTQGSSRPRHGEHGVVIWDGVLLDITARKQAQALQQRFAAILEASPDFIGIAAPSGQPLYINPQGRAMVGLTADEPITQLNVGSFHPDDAAHLVLRQAIPAAIQHGQWLGETRMRHKNGTLIPVSMAVICRNNERGEPEFLAAIARDISERTRAEEEQKRLHEEIVRVQSQALAELSTPLIALHQAIVLMPLIGTIDSQRALTVMDTLLNGAAEQQAQVVIVDVSGVPVVDTRVATTLIQAAQALRLLGAEVVISGIRPEIAQTIIGLGVDLSGITTFSRLNQGLQHAFQAVGRA